MIGDTVNIASRLQTLTRELKTPLVVADAVLKQIGDGAADGIEGPGRARTARPHRRHPYLDDDFGVDR